MVGGAPASKRQKRVDAAPEGTRHGRSCSTESPPQGSSCCCRWVPAAPGVTTRSFEVWLSTAQPPAPGRASRQEEPPAAAGFRWRVTCEKHIPFCVKELTGTGQLAHGEAQAAGGSAPHCAESASATVDLSRSGYGAVTLRVAMDDPKLGEAEAITVREVSTDLPEGRSMTRAPAAASSPAAAAAGGGAAAGAAARGAGSAAAADEGGGTAAYPPETWAGEHRWRAFGAGSSRSQQPQQQQEVPPSATPLKAISTAELAQHRYHNNHRDIIRAAFSI